MSGISFEDEFDRRRYARDAAVCDRRNRKEFRGAGGRKSGRELLSRCEPDADVDGSAGRKLGRARHDWPLLSIVGYELALFAKAGRGGTVPNGFWRRLRDGLACGSRARRGGNLHRFG